MKKSTIASVRLVKMEVLVRVPAPPICVLVLDSITEKRANLSADLITFYTSRSFRRLITSN
jgi:hypothetical protein